MWLEDGAAVQDVLRVADRRLYAAKNGGAAAVPDGGVALPLSGGA